jgi:hypothetical protein
MPTFLPVSPTWPIPWGCLDHNVVTDFPFRSCLLTHIFIHLTAMRAFDGKVLKFVFITLIVI